MADDIATAATTKPTDSEPIVDPTAAEKEPKGADAAGEKTQPKADGDPAATDDAVEGESSVTAIEASVEFRSRLTRVFYIRP